MGRNNGVSRLSLDFSNPSRNYTGYRDGGGTGTVVSEEPKTGRKKTETEESRAGGWVTGVP